MIGAVWSLEVLHHVHKASRRLPLSLQSYSSCKLHRCCSGFNNNWWDFYWCWRQSNFPGWCKNSDRRSWQVLVQNQIWLMCATQLKSHLMEKLIFSLLFLHYRPREVLTRTSLSSRSCALYKRHFSMIMIVQHTLVQPANQRFAPQIITRHVKQCLLFGQYLPVSIS